ncbi:ferredoxin-NADP reductase [Arsukibacterium sp. MJ3]|uniref:ferredoxin--NADP reductase n=1 Tax=Arsukibacterium sp. MJ3 TaxID=1632859 RepID=UPI0006271D38|nr:ferredoxin--NADP reductase [Arsukibacterium sp. MJ3]KKO48234.1 ferredoxin-NADP reductase [Arsukibacterium sp. MJ3]
MAQWLNATVAETIHWTSSLFSIKAKTGPLPFIAGQFVRLALEGPEGRLQRAYSLVNPPDSDYQEFLISTVADGLLSPLLQQLTPGDTLGISHPPTGFFILDEIPDGDNLWLIATGTGIGPYLSMLATSEPYQRFAKIILIHSVRSAADLAYQELIAGFAKQYPGQLHYQPIVTREPHPGALQDRIPNLITSQQLQQHCGQGLNEKSQVMLCGNPQMITDTKAVLESMGLKKNLRRTPGNITVEQYWK